MRILPLVLLGLSVVWGVSAQAPQAKLTYEDRTASTGHTLVVDGKSFGPYKEITSVTHSTSAASVAFVVNRRDKTYFVAQGRETGPLAAGFEPDQTWISDDAKVFAVSALHYDDSGDEGTSQTQLWVNGKLYGPFQSLSTLDYAESGGSWIASVQTGDDEYSVLLNGKVQGTFASIEHVWMFPDGKGWGFAGTDSEGQTNVVTQDRTYEAVANYNFDQMFPRDQHWGMGFRVADEEELIVVDGKSYPGYLNYSGLTLTPSGRHWGFEAQKLTDAGDYPVVVIDGREYPGEGLSVTALADKESFNWTLREGAKVTIQVLTQP